MTPLSKPIDPLKISSDDVRGDQLPLGGPISPERPNEVSLIRKPPFSKPPETTIPLKKDKGGAF